MTRKRRTARKEGQRANRRRTKGAGSVYEKRPGLWGGTVELPRDPKTGARRRKWIYGTSEIDVKDKMKRFDRTAEASSSDRTRVDAFLREWITDTIKPSMRPATAASYESVVEAHVIPAIGALRVAQLTPASVSRLYADLRDDGAGTRTLQKVHAVLHRAMSSAVTLGLIARNPAALEADVPKYRAPEREPLTAAQARALLKAARGDRLEALYVLALITGARQGELLALTWADVDFAKRALTIRRSLQDADGRGTLIRGATKTRSSRRRIELPMAAVDALRAHGERMRAEGRATDERSLIFQARNGEPIRRQNFLRRDFYPLLERAKLPQVHFHDLRHTAATLAAGAGKQVVAVAAMLGHVDPTITLRTYQHAFEGAAGDTARAIGDVLMPPARRSKKARQTKS